MTMPRHPRRPRVTYYTATCVTCGGTFPALDPETHYCSEVCSIRRAPKKNDLEEREA